MCKDLWVGWKGSPSMVESGTNLGCDLPSADARTDFQGAGWRSVCLPVRIGFDCSSSAVRDSSCRIAAVYLLSDVNSALPFSRAS